MIALDPAPSATWTFFAGEWREGNIPIMGPRTHAAWMGSTVFDGARAFEGTMPDLRAHCERVNQSARSFQLHDVVAVETWMGLITDGVQRFDAGAELYIRPMYWPAAGLGGGVRFDPDSTQWCLTIYEAPLPRGPGSAITLSPFRRPSLECAPVDAKASCLYPNGARALMEAHRRGFDNCLLRDPIGDIAELANANVFLARDGVAFTPAANGTFLDGITRARVIGLLRADGVEVVEKTLRYQDFLEADEIFSTGNFAKVSWIRRIEERDLPQGPIGRRARDLYWDFAHSK
jgi:branched-chain amino acid aminotransferase